MSYAREPGFANEYNDKSRPQTIDRVWFGGVLVSNRFS